MSNYGYADEAVESVLAPIDALVREHLGQDGAAQTWQLPDDLQVAVARHVSQLVDARDMTRPGSRSDDPTEQLQEVAAYGVAVRRLAHGLREYEGHERDVRSLPWFLADVCGGQYRRLVRDVEDALTAELARAYEVTAESARRHLRSIGREPERLLDRCPF